MNNKKYSFIFIGVSGSGKSAVAEEVSKKMNIAFLDGDFLHPRYNIDKMATGHPLDDKDREPWLEAINSAIYAMQRTNHISILVCSALKRKYRDALRKDNNNLYFIYLKGAYDLIAQRMSTRKGHFFNAEMLLSQFEILEEPLDNRHDIHIIDTSKPLNKVVDESVVFIHKILNT